ncbi:MAG: McrB family protein [Minisyncoccia bacterium]
MSNQSQDNQKIDILINLLNFLDCLVPCYTKSNGRRYYALVYYCDEKFKQPTGNNDFVKYRFDGKDIYLHRDTVNKVRGECQDCNFCDIVNNYKDFWDEIWNDLNIEPISDNLNINNTGIYETEGGKKKISIYQIVKQSNRQVPTPVFVWTSLGLLNVKCNKSKSIFIKDNVYIEIENIDNQSQNQQNQNQKHNAEQLLELKKLLITKTTENLLKVINNVIEQQIPVDKNLLEKAVEIILKNIDSNIANKNIILYGPPGTGKTYETRRIALTRIFGINEDFKFNPKFIKVFFDRFLSSGQIKFVTFHPSYSYEDFIEGIKPEIQNNSVIYTVQDGIFKQIVEEAKKHPDKNFVLIIDEINRGNIPSIFGELITLIEEDKRDGEQNAIKVTLPYSKKEFSVPKNLYIIGTMNTADKSIALLDIALRRRFSFKELMPNYNILSKVKVEVDGQIINLGKLLEAINKKVSEKIGRNYVIGHAYFLQYAEKDNNGKMYISLKNLNMAFRDKIIPLLQEYTNDDWELMHDILGKEFINVGELNIKDKLKNLELDISAFNNLISTS